MDVLHADLWLYLLLAKEFDYNYLVVAYIKQDVFIMVPCPLETDVGFQYAFITSSPFE